MSHWTKLDHVAFFIAFVLAIANIWLLRQDIGIAIFAMMLIALIYDVYEKR